MRKITSLTALASFCLLISTSIILYIVPAGRIAYWADWRFLGLSKESWGNSHINLGTLFLISMGLHIYYNWKPIMSYLKNKSREMKVFTPSFNVALAVTLLVFIGTLADLPPFSSFLGVSTSIKDAAAVKYGEPPYGHAELSTLKNFANKMRLDLDAGMAKMKAAGMKVENEKQSIKDIARANDVSPQQVFLAMKPAGETAKPQGLPEEPKPGLGKRVLADVCNEYNLKIPVVLSGLKSAGFTVDASMTMKAIGDKNGVSPHDIYEAIRAVPQG